MLDEPINRKLLSHFVFFVVVYEIQRTKHACIFYLTLLRIPSSLVLSIKNKGGVVGGKGVKGRQGGRVF